MTITVSCRNKPQSMGMSEWLSQYQVYNPIKITGVYGFMEEYSPLYGGRIYQGTEITKPDFKFLRDNNLQLKINLTGHRATEKEYEDSRELLNAYYYKNNVISVVDDNLAKWIKRDYPNYILEASVIKKVSFDTLDKTLKLYDQVVLPMALNDNLVELEGVKEKDRVILFANAGCGYTCKHQICYSSVSKINKREKGAEYLCSEKLKPRKEFKLYEFDVELLKSIGFKNFKYLSVAQGRAF